MTRPRRAFLASALALAAAWAAAQAASQATAPASRRALLVRGAASVKGLPFFAPNVLPCLAGAYNLSGSPNAPASPNAPNGAAAARAEELAVWYTREALVLGIQWKRADFGGFAAYSLDRPSGPVLMIKAARYYLFFEPPGTRAADARVADATQRAFVAAFDRKFSAFFENAAGDAELSFPAYVDY